MSLETSAPHAARERAALRIGGICTIVGACVFAVVRILHGDTPAADATASLDFMSGRPHYAFVHVTAVVAALLGLAAPIGAAGSFTDPVAWALGRIGVVSAVAGLAVFGVESTSEGLALPELAHAAAGASPAEQADLLRAARAVLAGTHGPSLVAVALLFGLPLVLVGAGLLRDAYPAWLAWAGIVIGAGTFAAAVGQYLDPDLMPGSVIYGLLASVLAQLWLLALAATLLRRTRPTRRNA
ncbi:hypothetical protein ACQEVB_14745 [Pseudonocardia sp. CA-107938]|uniref:hypothetical protein n=1 Tax=Pseudonocardia sp. CA-107938 TaxID=3240021 RepID=UPI003D9306B9